MNEEELEKLLRCYRTLEEIIDKTFLNHSSKYNLTVSKNKVYRVYLENSDIDIKVIKWRTSNGLMIAKYHLFISEDKPLCNKKCSNVLSDREEKELNEVDKKDICKTCLTTAKKLKLF